MKRFLAVYTGSPAALSKWEVLTESERNRRQAEGMAAWHKWAADNSATILETGDPLSRTKLVSSLGISDIRNNMAAFTIVQAESQEEAARLFLNHPHFTIFPGEGVELSHRGETLSLVVLKSGRSIRVRRNGRGRRPVPTLSVSWHPSA